MHTAVDVSDSLDTIRNHLNHINILMQDVMGDYFGKYDRDNRNDHLGIVWDFLRAGVKADIISDELLAMSQQLTILESILGGRGRMTTLARLLRQKALLPRGSLPLPFFCIFVYNKRIGR